MLAPNLFHCLHFEWKKVYNSNLGWVTIMSKSWFGGYDNDNDDDYEVNDEDDIMIISEENDSNTYKVGYHNNGILD